MATHYRIRTSAGEQDVRAAFRAVFFAPSTAADRAKQFFDGAAARRSAYAWRETRRQDAVEAATLVSEHGLAKILDQGGRAGNVVVALVFHDHEPETLAEIWLAESRTRLGINLEGGLLKRYAKEITTGLARHGHSAMLERS